MLLLPRFLPWILQLVLLQKDGEGWKYAAFTLACSGAAAIGAGILKRDKNRKQRLLEKKSGLEAKLKESGQ